MQRTGRRCISIWRVRWPLRSSELSPSLVRSAGGSQNRLGAYGLRWVTTGVTKIPGAAVSFEDAETLADLARTGKVRVHLTLTPQTLPDAESYNVIGDIKGSEKPDEIVVVGGHLDSWDLGTGAIDDACRRRGRRWQVGASVEAAEAYGRNERSESSLA